MLHFTRGDKPFCKYCFQMLSSTPGSTATAILWKQFNLLSGDFFFSPSAVFVLPYFLSLFKPTLLSITLLLNISLAWSTTMASVGPCFHLCPSPSPAARTWGHWGACLTAYIPPPAQVNCSWNNAWSRVSICSPESTPAAIIPSCH